MFHGHCVRHGRPGGDLLSHTLRCSTIGAEGFHFRVRDGIGCGPLAIATRPSMPDGVHEELHQEKVIDVLRSAGSFDPACCRKLPSGEVSRSVLSQPLSNEWTKDPRRGER